MAKEKDNSFNSALETIYQTFDGQELYPSIERKPPVWQLGNRSRLLQI